jgi:hypothetical protein
MGDIENSEKKRGLQRTAAGRSSWSRPTRNKDKLKKAKKTRGRILGK